MNKISAKIIADSINEKGNRLTTFVLTFPRFILAELNTHRVFSRNSASSRAIPFSKMLKMVSEDPFIPIAFQKDHKGMQGTEYFAKEQSIECIQDWLNARDLAVEAATSFRHPVTKQLRNRILEPFLWHTVILSGTEFDNFFKLRNHKDAEIHICALASAMQTEYKRNTPKLLGNGEWHMPYGDRLDEERISKLPSGETAMTYKLYIATARCARVSYLNHEGKDDYEADVRLCRNLFENEPRHLSPTEHIATPSNNVENETNFRGWIQFRKLIETSG